MSELRTLCENLLAAHHSLAAASAAIEEANKALVEKDLILLIKDFDWIRNTYDNLDDNRKLIFGLIEKLSRETIPAKMDAQDITSIKIDGVGRVSLGTRVSVSMLDKQAGMEWLRENGHGDIIQETVNASTLSAFSKSLLEEEGVELPDDKFKTSTMRYTSITKR